MCLPQNRRQKTQSLSPFCLLVLLITFPPLNDRFYFSLFFFSEHEKKFLDLGELSSTYWRNKLDAVQIKKYKYKTNVTYYASHNFQP